MADLRSRIPACVGRSIRFVRSLVDDETFATYRVEPDGDFYIDLWNTAIERPR